MQLNEPVQNSKVFPQNYKVFPEEGTDIYVNQMPKLIAEGRTPLSTTGLMKRRLEVKNASEPVRNSWLYNRFDTGDGIIYHPDGRAKIALDAQPLREITPSSKLINGALVLDSYDGFGDLELSKEELEKYEDNDSHKRKEVLNNRIWRMLARHPDEVPEELAEDPKLLKEYSDLVFLEGFDRRVIGLYKFSPQDTPTMRAWYVYRLAGSWSNAFNWGRLDDKSALLVGVAGVAPEVRNAPQEGVVRPTLEQVTAVINPHLSNYGRDVVMKDLERLYQ
ncbi:MAG: hypothetical protein KKB79_00030 [Nanoarchaeota archaeon]|nr:hypothetical protein [Nanoarchaeota archaeon]